MIRDMVFWMADIYIAFGTHERNLEDLLYLGHFLLMTGNFLFYLCSPLLLDSPYLPYFSFLHIKPEVEITWVYSSLLLIFRALLISFTSLSPKGLEPQVLRFSHHHSLMNGCHILYNLPWKRYSPFHKWLPNLPHWVPIFEPSVVLHYLVKLPLRIARIGRI